MDDWSQPEASFLLFGAIQVMSSVPTDPQIQPNPAPPPCLCDKSRCQSHDDDDDDEGELSPTDDLVAKRAKIQSTIATLERDPHVRKPITSCPPNTQDLMRLAYLELGPFRAPNCRLAVSWIAQFPWLECGETPFAYCFYCYVMDPGSDSKKADGGKFSTSGFHSWDKAGGANGSFAQHHSSKRHQDNFAACLSRQKEAAQVDFRMADACKMTWKANKLRQDRNRARLNTSIDCVRWLARQALAFRGNDESETSKNRGNFLELVKFVAGHNPKIAANVLRNAPQNNMYISPGIQNDIIRAFASRTLSAILSDVGDSKYCIMLDESSDVSGKEQLAVMIRYVNRLGVVVEAFLGLVHVKTTAAKDLWTALQQFLDKEAKLSIDNIRGQCFDGASNMRGEFNGLQALISAVNPSAFFVHCFAHQLQLALVAAAKETPVAWQFFSYLGAIVNLIQASPKRRDQFRDEHAELTAVRLEIGELSTGKGLNQETSLRRAGDTRWGSHSASISSLLVAFPETVHGLHEIAVTGTAEKRGEASGLIEHMCTFRFCLLLHILDMVLGYCNDLCRLLQRAEQDIVNAVNMVGIAQERLAEQRGDEEWLTLLDVVIQFCYAHDIDVPDMDASYQPAGRKKEDTDQQLSNRQHFQFNIFNVIIDQQSTTLARRFPEKSKKLLKLSACFDPRDSFAAFKTTDLFELAEMYSRDFDATERHQLKTQLGNFHRHMTAHPLLKPPDKFKSIGQLANLLVRNGLHLAYPLVYRLLTLVLTLPVTTASVERTFSALALVKTDLRNKLSDQTLSDLVLLYVERGTAADVSNDEIIALFEQMSDRREAVS